MHLGCSRQAVRNPDKVANTTSSESTSIEVLEVNPPAAPKSEAESSECVAAEDPLLARNDTGSVPALIVEWKRLTDQKSARAFAHPFEHDDGSRALIRRLATCGNADAIRALARNLDRQPPDRRLEVVSSFGERRGSFSEFSIGPGGALNLPDDATELTEDTRAAAEELLVGSLDDNEERTGMSGKWNGLSFNDPRICDIAAFILADRWKTEYEFDLTAPIASRNRQLIAIKNVWRRKRNLPALPLPESKQFARLPDEILDSLLRKVQTASTDREREGAIKEIETLGLPALHAVNKARRTTPKGAPAYVSLENLVSRLNTIVSDIEILGLDLESGDAYRKLIDDLNGKPLKSNHIIDLLAATATSLPEGVTGIKLICDRIDDDCGIRLTVTLATTKIPQAGTQKGWHRSERVDAGVKTLQSTFGTLSVEYARDAAAYDNFARAVEMALATAPEQALEIRISLIREE